MRVSRTEVTTAPDRPKAKAKAKATKSAVRRRAPAKPADRLEAAKPRTFELKTLLETAGRVRRSPGPEGTEPVLGRAERERITALFGKLPAAKSAALQRVLLSVPDGAPQALVLKAIAARSTRLPTDARALSVIEKFGKLIANVPEAELLERATVLDLDSRVSTSDVDLMPLWNKRGTTREGVPHGEATDNDGLFQRFTATCGPTVIQMMRAQTDPVLAFAINAEGRNRDTIQGETARFQAALLEEYGGIAIGRRESYVMARVHNIAGRLGLKGDALSAANVAAVRAKYDGFPSDDDVKRVKAALVPARDAGISFDDFRGMLERYVSNVTGAKYTQTTPADGFARGQAWRHLDAVEKAVNAGYDVPCGMVDPAHWLLITDARGKAPARDFLVSDPDGGRTAWVSEKTLVDGSFAAKQFQLPKPGERAYVDSFFLPTHL